MDDLVKTNLVPHDEGQNREADATSDSKFSALKSWLKRHLIFTLTVLVPTICAIVYYGLIASDIYTSESRFLVRSPQKPAPTGLLGDFLQSSGITHSQDDTYSVRDFIL